MARIFLSHSASDKGIVQKLCNDLRLLGHEPWLDEEQIQVGQSIPARLAEAIEASDFLAVALSKRAVDSGWVREEWQSKFWEQVSARVSRVLPLLLEDCDVPTFLTNRAYADFRDSYGVGLVKLVRSLELALRPSPLTPDSDLLNRLINTYIESLARAVSLPQSAGRLKVRVFVFRAEHGELVCRYHWAQDPVEEKVGLTRFVMDETTAKEVAVVRAAINKKTCRTPVRPLLPESPGVLGDVDDDLSYVLAAPILRPDGTVWGTVDFDTATEAGTHLLATEEANAAIRNFAKHLEIVLTGR